MAVMQGPGPGVVDISIDDQIACVDRELSMRERVYPRWVNAPKPKMTPKTMELELARMRAVRQTLLDVRSGALARASS